MPSKYMGEKKDKIQKIIKEGRRKGISNDEIAKLLNKEKLTTSKGTKFTGTAVFNFIYRTGLGEPEEKVAIRPIKPPPFGQNLDLAQMLLDSPDLSDSAKVEAVRAILKQKT